LFARLDLFAFLTPSAAPSSLYIANQFQNTKDPYKHLLLNICGRIDPNKSYQAIPKWSVQDWTWLQVRIEEETEIFFFVVSYINICLVCLVVLFVRFLSHVAANDWKEENHQRPFQGLFSEGFSGPSGTPSRFSVDSFLILLLDDCVFYFLLFLFILLIYYYFLRVSFFAWHASLSITWLTCSGEAWRSALQSRRQVTVPVPANASDDATVRIGIHSMPF
jgi:hypothetical protein